MRLFAYYSIVFTTAVAGCAQFGGIEETVKDPEYGERDTPGSDDRHEGIRPSCSLMLAYIGEWAVARLDDTALLHGFVVVANQSDFTIDLTPLAVDYYGDTHTTVEVDVETEPWIEDGLRLTPGQQTGYVTASAMTILGELLSLPSVNMADNLLRIEIREWLAAADFERSVSAEITFTLNRLKIEMPMRFIPRDETRPLKGRYTCAFET